MNVENHIVGQRHPENTFSVSPAAQGTGLSQPIKHHTGHAAKRARHARALLACVSRPVADVSRRRQLVRTATMPLLYYRARGRTIEDNGR